MGAINLHNQSIKRNWKIINFFIASSVASIIGSTDQCAYVGSCSVVDSLSRYRESIGLPSTCINIGNIESIGFVAKNESVLALLDGSGLDPTSINKLLGSIDLQLQNPQHFANSIVSNFGFQGFLKYKEQNSLLLKFDYYLNLCDAREGILKEKLDSNLNDLFIKKVSGLLSINESKINHDIRLNDYGADSLVIVQLKNWIDKEIGENLITIQQLQNNSIKLSIQLVHSSLKNNNNFSNPTEIKINN